MKFFTKTVVWLVALPYALILLGAASNQLVLIANGGKFPVLLNEIVAARFSADGMIDKEHCVMTNQTRLNALADIFNFGDIESVGDLSIDLGAFLQPFTFGAWLAVVIRKLNS